MPDASRESHATVAARAVAPLPEPMPKPWKTADVASVLRS